MNSKYYLVTFRIYNGEYEHYQHATIQVVATDNHDERARFRAERMCSKMYGWGERTDDVWIFHGGDIAASVKRIRGLLPHEYIVLQRYLG